MMVRSGTTQVSVKMKLVIGFAVLVVSQSGYSDSNCNNILVNNYSYEKEILLDNVSIPYQLAIDYDTKTLFFSYTRHDDNNRVYSSAFLNLKTGKYKVMTEVRGGFANTVDNHKCIVYVGGEDGIYKFDYETETATHVEGTNHNIWQLFFKKRVYYTTFPHGNVYVFQDGQSTTITELADTKAKLVAQSNGLDYYFTNTSGLFKVKKANGEIISLGTYKANAMTADDYGNLYFSTFNGIYLINEKDEVAVVATIPGVYGVAIESDRNIIYSTYDSIVRLKPARYPCSPH